MEIGYVYKWVELTTGKWYIGARGGKGCHPDDGYICSSKIVKPLIEKNPEGWQREILFTGDPDEVFYIEAELLKKLDAKHDPQSFNKHNGDGKWSMRGKTFNEEHRKKMGAWQIGRKFSEETIAKRTKSRENFHQPDEARKKISQSLRGRVNGPLSDDQKQKISQALTGRVKGPLSDAHRKLLSEIKKGYKHTEESIQRMRDAHKGKILTEEHKEKISSSSLGHKKSEETKARMRHPKVKSPCPHCGLMCAPHLLQRHINARHPE